MRSLCVLRILLTFATSALLALPARTAPVITELSDTVLPCNGYVEVRGTGFTDSPGSLLVGGVEAAYASWGDGEIVGYLPEGTTLGPNTIEVINGDGPSGPFPIEVEVCQPYSSRIAWRQRFDSLYTFAAPVVGPDGTIHVLDVDYRMYAVAPTGHVRWVVDGSVDAPSGEPTFGNTSLDVGADGTVYSANRYAVSAVHGDGSLRWRVDHPLEVRSYLVYDTRLGPDGHLYIAASETLPDGHGVYSLTTDGGERWNVQHPYGRTTRRQRPILFGEGPRGPQLYFSANSNSYALALADGEVVFDNLPQVTGFAAMGPLDDSVHASGYAFSPEGDILWQSPEFLNGRPAIDSTGVHYATTSMVVARMFALERDGAVRYEVPLSNATYVTSVTPDDALLINTDTANLMLVLDASDASELWRIELPNEGSAPPTYPDGRPGYWMQHHSEFSADGTVAYHLSAINTAGVMRKRTYLNAVTVSATAIAEDVGPSLLLAGDHLEWQAVAAPEGYDVAIGDLADLRALGHSAATELSCGQLDPWLEDPTSPPRGQALYYIVRAHGGTWGGPSEDAAITSCP